MNIEAEENSPELPREFVEYVSSITAKRAKTFIDHILKYGYITTEDLSET